ncbi:acyltransferase family protein [Novosphingobium sp. FGD1]|jgi:glucan biosynthesis protein C|uniref:Acyltransferase family protein n=1 Tax=Novosphingobium silvae TaxID=2692619 RepID=A0A7X4K7G5_9SPHN|nr:acyltransferase [Novosphingobium silvae]MYL98125.1 acyltransferase family protein [Novosphingobium silvae]
MQPASTLRPMPARPHRHYGMDWLRIGAFVMLIFYHVGFSFTPWGYQTPTRGVVPWAEIPLLGLSAWRLALLFAISGYASAALLTRDADAASFLKSRLLRLGIPLLFGLTVIVPPQPYMGLVNSGYAHGYGYFLLHDAFSFRRVIHENLPAVMHLWFVIYLLAYTVALCLAQMALPARWRVRLHLISERLLAGGWLLPIGCGLVYTARSVGGEWTDTHAILTDFAAHLHYGGMFLFGFLLRRSGPLHRTVARQWKPALLLGLAGYAFVALEAWYFPGNVRTPRVWLEPLDFAKAVQCWGTVIALFGIADRFWNRDGRWRATLVEAVFPVFIAHQTVMVLVSYWLRDKGLTALPEFLVLCASVAVGSWLFYLAGREIGPLRPLIGLKRAKTPRRAKAIPIPSTAA